MTQSPEKPSPPAGSSIPAPVVALGAWLVPGLGYILIGHRARGITVFVTILALFVLGMLIGGMKVVDPFTTYTLQGILQKPWYVGQLLTGPIAIVCSRIAQDPSFVVSHARVNEIGTLYTAVAGMLNLLTIIDSSARAAGVASNA